MILGSVYNATHATPEPVPQRSTRSGIRTQTSPGGGGFNELSFEDARGVERVYVHAQKDFEETVNDTHTLNVKNNQKVTISNRQETEVGGDRLTAVGGSAATIVGGSDSTHVRGDRVVNVLRNETLVVNGNATRSVDGVSVESVKADQLTVVDGERNVTVRGSSITQIGGKDPDAKVAEVTYVQGRSIHTASDGTLIRVERPTTSAAVAIRLECGDSFIEVGPQKITLSSPTVEVHGSDKVKMASKDSHLSLDRDSALLQSKSAGLSTPDGSKMMVDGKHATTSAPGQATTKASKIDFRRGDGDAKKDEQKKDPPAEGPSLKLKFLHGKDGSAPIGNAKYRVIVDDLVFEGMTNASGELNAKVPETAKVAFVTLWANLVKPEIYPTGPLQWLVHILPELGATSTRGLRVRLRNLGYEPATKLDPSDIDDVTRGALLEFQLDRDLVATGVLDEDTKTRLTTTYGS